MEDEAGPFEDLDCVVSTEDARNAGKYDWLPLPEDRKVFLDGEETISYTCFDASYHLVSEPSRVIVSGCAIDRSAHHGVLML